MVTKKTNIKRTIEFTDEIFVIKLDSDTFPEKMHDLAAKGKLAIFIQKKMRQVSKREIPGHMFEESFVSLFGAIKSHFQGGEE